MSQVTLFLNVGETAFRKKVDKKSYFNSVILICLNLKVGFFLVFIDLEVTKATF